MFKWFKKKSSSPRPTPTSASAPNEGITASTPAELTWDDAATQALNMAMQQAPVPTLLKGKVRQELMNAAEDTARAAGRNKVTAEDLMNGLMAKLPPKMQTKARKMAEQKMKEIKNKG